MSAASGWTLAARERSCKARKLTVSAILLTLRNISKIYGERLILKNVSLDLSGGMLALVLGPNGVGKSTLMRIMARLAAPSSGTMQVRDNIKIGYLGHATFLYPALTALENLSFQARINSLAYGEGEFLSLLERVRLLPFAHEPARHFSRGMAQRLNFARALMLRPDLLLLDEPFTGLDADSSQLMRDELAVLRKAGAAIALVSHSPAKDLALASHVFKLSGGKLVFAGAVQEYQPGGADAAC